MYRVSFAGVAAYLGHRIESYLLPQSARMKKLVGPDSEVLDSRTRLLTMIFERDELFFPL